MIYKNLFSGLKSIINLDDKAMIYTIYALIINDIITKSLIITIDKNFLSAKEIKELKNLFKNSVILDDSQFITSVNSEFKSTRSFFKKLPIKDINLAIKQDHIEQKELNLIQGGFNSRPLGRKRDMYRDK